MIRLSLLLWIMAIGVAAIGLYNIKDKVQDIEAELARTEAQIISDREAVHVLRAEWAYLNKPGRLAELSERYLDLQPLDHSHLVSFEGLPTGRPAGEDGLEGEVQQASSSATSPAQNQNDNFNFDSMLQLIESTNSEPPTPTGAITEASTSDSHTRPRVLVNPVTHCPCPAARLS